MSVVRVFLDRSQPEIRQARSGRLWLIWLVIRTPEEVVWLGLSISRVA
jgi:hypothetical protein